MLRHGSRRGGNGQATIELAMVFPVMILLMVALVDLGRMANASLIVHNLAREGVRLGITGASDSAITTRIQAISTGLNTAYMRVTISPSGTRLTGSDVTVRVEYDYQVIAMSQIFGTQFTLGAQLTGRVE